MTYTLTEAALFLSRWIELSMVGKATILLVLAITAARLMERSRASLRHLLLAATFAALTGLPFVLVTFPRVPIALSFYQDGDATSDSLVSRSNAVPPLSRLTSEQGSAESSFSSLPSWLAIGRFVWIAGAILSLAPLVVNLLSVRRLRREGLPSPEMFSHLRRLAAKHGISRPVEVLLHEQIAAPLTCGFWHPAILLPVDVQEWSPAELRCALVHELEHIRRGDWAVQLTARAVRSFYWFHPLIWIAWRRLCLEAERACDDAVVQNEEQTGYAAQLVSLARRMAKTQTQSALGIANRSDLSKRVSAVLDDSQRRGRYGAWTLAAAIAAAALLVLAIAPLEAVAQSTNRNQTGRSAEISRALYEAAEEGGIPDIERLLNAGADVNSALPNDGSPLIGAARKGRLAAVRLLLDRGADPNLPVRGDGNPLIMAAREGHADVVTLLLDRGANINQVVPDDENALIQASAKGRLDVVKLLVSCGAEVNSRVWVERGRDTNGEWRSALSMARKGSHSLVAGYLSSVGARE